MQIITDVKPTKELEAAIAAELQEDKSEIAIANLIKLSAFKQRETKDDQPECGPRNL